MMPGKIFSALLCALLLIAPTVASAVTARDQILIFTQPENASTAGRSGEVVGQPGAARQRARRLFAHDRANLVGSKQEGKIIEQGLCRPNDCAVRTEFSQLAGHASRQIGDVDVIQDLVFPGRRQLVVSWNISAPENGGPGSSLTQTDGPEGYEVLVIEESRYRIFSVTDQSTPRKPVRSRGISNSSSARGKKGDQTKHGKTPHRETLRPAQRLRFDVLPDQEVEVHIRSLSSSEKQSKPSLPEGLGIQYVANQSTSDSTQPTIVSQSGKGDTPIGSIAFIDSALEQCVLLAVDGDTQFPAHQLTSLSCHDAGIENLTGIEYLVGLQVLDLSSNRITDLSSLSPLTNLVSLNLSNNGHDASEPSQGLLRMDLAPLASLPDIEFLHLDGNRIFSITDLAQLTQLDTLTLSETEVDYIPDLSATALRVADFSHSPVDDIAGLEHVLSLELLNLTESELGDLTPLINNAQDTQTSLARIHLDLSNTLSCVQVADLVSLVGSSNVSFTSGDCVGLQPPHSLSSTDNPSILNTFSLSWVPTDPPDEVYYEIRPMTLSRPELEVISVSGESYDFAQSDMLDPGAYIFQVRMCEPTTQGCSGWSAGVEQVVLADPSLPFDDALTHVEDVQLVQCLSEHKVMRDMDSGQLVDLTCRDRQIADLTGLERFPGIQTLDLSDNDVQGLTPLELLASLSRVTLAGNPVSSGALGSLTSQHTKFEMLDLSRTSISDISALDALQGILVLDISSTSVSDLSPISHVFIPDLRASLTQVTAIPLLTGTVALAVDRSNVSDLSGLTSVASSLEIIVLTDNPLGSGGNHSQWLAQLSALRSAYLGYTGIGDLSFVSGWSDLEALSLEGNSLSMTSGLASLGSLQWLDLDLTGIENLDFLTSTNTLRTLHVRGSEVSDLNPISNLSQLEVLNFSGGDLSAGDSVSPLMGLLALEELSIAGSGLADVSALVTLAEDSGSSLTSVDLVGEQQLPCSQLMELWNLDVLENSGSEAGVCVAGQPEMLGVVLARDMTSYDVRWTQPDTPPGFYAAGQTRIDYESGSTQGAQWVDSGAESSVIQLDPAPQAYYRFRAANCDGSGNCSQPTNWVYAQYPMMRPRGAAAELSSDQSALLEWTYPDMPPADQADIYFVIKPMFPVADSHTVSWGGGDPWMFSLSDPSSYPGRAASIQACHDASSGPRCGPEAYVTFRETPEEPVDGPIAAVEGVQLYNRPESEFGYRLTWHASPDPRVDFYRVQELVVDGATADPVASSFTATKPAVDLRRYIPNQGGQTAFRIAACSGGPEDDATCSPAVDSNPVSISTAHIDLSRPVKNLCWTALPTGPGMGARMATLRWTYPSSGQPGSDLDPPVKFTSRIVSGETTDSENTEVKAVYAKSRYNAGTDTSYYESTPVWVAPGSTLEVRAAAGDAESPRATIQPLSEYGQVHSHLRCNQFEVYDTAPELNGPVNPGLMSPGHWSTAPYVPEGADEPHYIGNMTGWQFYWSNEMASLDGEQWNRDESFDLIAIWMTYENRAETSNDLEDWTPVWYYAKLQVQEENGIATSATGALLLPVKNGSDTVAGHVDVFFLGEPGGDDQTPGSREAWIRVELGDDSGSTTGKTETFPVRDMLTDDILIDPDWFYDNPHDHFRGIWVDHGSTLFNEDDGSILENTNFMLSEWIVGDMLSWAVLGFDDSDESRPIWLISFKCANGDDESEDCDDEQFDEFQHQAKSEFHTVYPGSPPFETYPVAQVDSGEGPPANVVQAGWGSGVSRYYKGTSEFSVPMDHRELRSCVQLHGEFGTGDIEYDYSFAAGSGQCIYSSSATEHMHKVANRHHIDFAISGDEGEDEDICQMQNGGSGDVCPITIEWSTDDDFSQYSGPDVVPMVTVGGSATPVDMDAICQNFDDLNLEYTASDESCQVVEPGTYRLRLVSRPQADDGSGPNDTEWLYDEEASAIIATSRILHVNGFVPPQPAAPPVGPGPESQPASDPLFGCEGSASGCSSEEPSDELLATSNVGATRGRFRVTEKGAAEYTIPIMTAKGVAGVEPEIALQYNSQQSDDGPMGRSWNVSGLSAINRCGQTRTVDGDSTGVTISGDDRFCLDGQRMILIDGDYGQPGSQYRLEVDNLTKIHAFAGQAAEGVGYFEVYRSDGSVSTYGYSPQTVGSVQSAEVLAPQQGVPFAWPISRFADSVGNYIRYEYQQPDVGNPGHERLIQWMPKRIKYTGYDGVAGTRPTFATIKFSYNYRSPDDRPKRFIQGNYIYTTRLLGQITSYSDGKLLRSYNPNYEQEQYSNADLMVGIQECYSTSLGIDDSESIECFEETSFEWLKPGRNSAINFHADTEFVLFNNHRASASADLSGNGREEFVLGNAGYDYRATFQVFKNVTQQSEDELDFDSAPHFTSECNPSYSELGGWVLADINDDGRSELIYAVNNCGGNGEGLYYHAWDSGAGTLEDEGTHFADLPEESLYHQSSETRLSVADLDGDGRMDLVLSAVDVGTSTGPRIWFYKNNTSGANPSFEPSSTVSIDYSNVFDGGTGSPEDDVWYGIEIFDSGVVALDKSGQASILARVSQTVKPDGDNTPIPRSFATQDGGYLVPQDEFTQLFSSLERDGDVQSTHLAYAWRLESDGSGGFELVPGLRVDQFDTGLGEDYFARSIDFNRDGYTDFVQARKQGDSTRFSLLINEGTAHTDDSDEAIPFATLRFEFTAEVKFKMAKRTLIFESTGDSRPDLHVPTNVPELSFWEYRRYGWPWVEDMSSGSEAVLAESNRYSDLFIDECYDQLIPIDLFGNGRMSAISVYSEEYQDTDCQQEYFAAVRQANAYVQGEEFTPAEERYVDAPVINGVSDGFGARTEIEYTTTGDIEVYSRFIGNGGEPSLTEDAVVLPMGAPLTVVKSVQSTADEYTPSGEPILSGEVSMAGVRYAYAGAKIEAGGRGFLGFSQVITYDERSGVLTASRYRQDFPFIGRPSGSMRWKVQSDPWAVADSPPVIPSWGKDVCEGIVSGGANESVILGCSFKEWKEQTSALGGPVVFVESEVEYHWSAITSAVGEITDSKFTYVDKASSTIDEFGNVKISTREIFTSESASVESRVYEQTVSNEYLPQNLADQRWHIGRLECSDVETFRRDPANSDDHNLTRSNLRTTRYGYAPDIGLLDEEVIESTPCAQSGSSPYLTTSYEHDNFGNVNETQSVGHDGVTRRSRKIFSAVSGEERGRYVRETQVYLDGTSDPWRRSKRIESRDRYGNPLEVIDSRGQVTYNYFDLSGKPYYSYSDSGSWEKSVSASCGDSNNGSSVACLIGSESVLCPVGAEFAQIKSTAGGAKSYICKDVLGREIRAGSRVVSDSTASGFRWSFQDKRYDYASRETWITEPYLSGNPVFWSEIDYDEAGRIMSVRHDTDHLEGARSTVETREYDGFLTTFEISTDAGDQVRQEIRNPMGEVVAKTVAVGTSEEATTTFVYTPLGDLKKAIAPVEEEAGSTSLSEVEIFYDEFGNRSALSDPDKGDWVYAHNSHGELICQFDEGGRGVVNAYDSLGRVVTRTDVEASGWIPQSADCLSWVQEDGSIILPGSMQTKSETTWQYGEDQEVPTDIQQAVSYQPFGEVTVEETRYLDAASVEIDKEYNYDLQARLRKIDSSICTGTCQNSSNVHEFEERITYDRFGRVFQRFDASSSFLSESPYDDPEGSNAGGNGQKYEYAFGHLIAIDEARNASSGTPYWRLIEMDARGKAVESHYGNGMELNDVRDPETGELKLRIQEAQTYYGYSVGQFIDLDWDDLGRLQSKIDMSLSGVEQYERYQYDTRDRLTHVHASLDGQAWQETLSMEYDLSGNIQSKSDVQGPYLYDGSPHAVTCAGGRAFEYDAAGNLKRDYSASDCATMEDDVREYTYHAFQKVLAVQSYDEDENAERVSEFYYGPDRARVVHVESLGGVTEELTFYVGNVEVHVDETGTTEYRRSIGGKVLVTLNGDTGQSRTRYLHRDHLGSIVALSDETGYVLARMSFDPWGKRRSPEHVQSGSPWNQWLSGNPPAWLVSFGDATQFTPRGYTGHEHLDELGIIHMNGRIYDPHLARFLQADPFVEDSGTINRYTYAHNNPLVYYDPSGYTSFKDIVRSVISVAISVYTGGAAASGQWALFGAGAESLNAVSTVMIGGALSGAVASGSWDGALWGAFSGAAFYGVGQLVSSSSWAAGSFAGSGLSGAQFATKAIGHGLVGGVVSDLRGGKFGHGFASSFVSATSHPYIANGLRGRTLAQATVSAIVGGTASRLSGGKFANGAATAAMAYAFNQSLQEVAENAAQIRDRHDIVRAAARLTSKEDFLALFPSYADYVAATDLSVAQAHMEKDFTIKFIKEDGQELLNSAVDVVRQEYHSAGFGALRGNRHVMKLIGARAGLSSRQTELVTDIATVASHLDTQRATTENLSRLAEQFRQDPEVRP